jgi:hypothetical protein
MRTLALTTAAILIVTTAMADVTCDLILVPNPKLPRDCLELQAIPLEHRSAMYLLFNCAEDSALWTRR